MSKYYKAEDVERLIENIINVMIGKEEPMETALCELPTIEVSEDFVKDTDVPISEDCISRDEVTKALRLEYPSMPLFREMREGWHLKTEGYHKAEEIIRDAPSVAPTTEQSSIVRCNDCKHYHASKHYAYCTVINVKGEHPQPNDYCSYAEEK